MNVIVHLEFELTHDSVVVHYDNYYATGTPSRFSRRKTSFKPYLLSIIIDLLSNSACGSEIVQICNAQLIWVVSLSLLIGFIWFYGTSTIVGY